MVVIFQDASTPFLIERHRKSIGIWYADALNQNLSIAAFIYMDSFTAVNKYQITLH